MNDVSSGANKKWTAKSLPRNTEVRELFNQCGREITPIVTQRKVEKMGYHASCNNCVNALARLKREFYGDEHSQYASLPDCCDRLNKNKHIAYCEVKDGTFSRMAVLYREGLHGFRMCPSRGLSVDGIFLKTCIGGTLLMACFLNGSHELQIIDVAIVPTENYTNWSFFLRFLVKHLSTKPMFIISDRDKGLVPAVLSLDEHAHHFFCFRHLMENFNKKFKSKELKNAAWALARATSTTQFDIEVTKMRTMNLKAVEWLMDVGKEKWSLCYSPCQRYGLLTSNSVESVNSALQGIRKLPILDCLMSIERYVGTKWATSVQKCVKWGLLTKKASTRVESTVGMRDNVHVSVFSDTSFLITTHMKRGDRPVKYTVQLKQSTADCSCGYHRDMMAPCSHSIVCLRLTNGLDKVSQYFDATWVTSTYTQAYSMSDECNWPPPILKGTLKSSNCTAPRISKKRGRPKKQSRRESQPATLLLTHKTKKIPRCTFCGQPGHNKRRHAQRRLVNVVMHVFHFTFAFYVQLSYMCNAE